MIHDEQVLPGADWGLLIFGQTMLGENLDVGERFMTAYITSVLDFLEGKTEENVALLAEATELEVELIAAACWPSFKSDGSVETSHMMEFQLWAQERGLLDNIVPENEIYNDHFVEFVKNN